MRFTCPRATLDDKRIVKSYLQEAGSTCLWPDDSLTITTRRLSRQQLDALAILLEMLGLEFFLKPTAEGEADLLPV